MKIAISHANASYMMGGSVVYVWRLARYLQDHGHDVWLIAGEVAEPVVLDSAVRLKMFKFRRRERFPDIGSRFQRLMERCSFGWHARQFLAGERFDILNIHKPYDLPIAAWVKKRSGCGIVWRCHGPDHYPGLSHFLKYSDANYCVSEFARADLVAKYGVAAEVIHTGVDTAFFAPSKESVAVPAKKPTILYFGRMEGWKGVHYLVRTLAHLRPDSYTTEIVGDGPEADAIRVLITELGLQDRVFWKPALRSREEIKQLLDRSDIVAFPAIAVETMSNAMLEAMAMAKPMVASRVGCFAEVLRQDETALLVEPRDVKQMAGALQKLIDNPALRISLGANARHQTIDEFEATASFRKVEALFQQVCRSRSVPLTRV